MPPPSKRSKKFTGDATSSIKKRDDLHSSESSSEGDADNLVIVEKSRSPVEPQKRTQQHMHATPTKRMSIQQQSSSASPQLQRFRIEPRLQKPAKSLDCSHVSDTEDEDGGEVSLFPSLDSETKTEHQDLESVVSESYQTGTTADTKTTSVTTRVSLPVTTTDTATCSTATVTNATTGESTNVTGGSLKIEVPLIRSALINRTVGGVQPCKTSERLMNISVTITEFDLAGKK